MSAPTQQPRATEPTTPTAPVPVPQDLTVVVLGDAVFFGWNPIVVSDPVAAVTIRYELQLSRTSNFSNPKTTVIGFALNVAEFSLAALEREGNYSDDLYHFARVRAEVGGRWSDYSASIRY